MPSKYYTRNFVPGLYYHIYNRGSRKQNIFSDNHDYDTFIQIVTYYLKFPVGKPLSQVSIDSNKTEQIPEVINPIKSSFNIAAYCLLPNHFHLLLKQVSKGTNENDITNFMRRLSISYSMYFKKKYKNSGNIFEGKYKNVIVDNNNQLVYLTKYIHKNPTDLLTQRQTLEDYPHSSYSHYLNKTTTEWLDNNEIKSFFSKDKPNLTYKAFVEGKPDFPEALKHLTLE